MKQVRFSTDQLAKLLQLPAGAKIHRVATEPYGIVQALVEHSSFDDVPDALQPPEVPVRLLVPVKKSGTTARKTS